MRVTYRTVIDNAFKAGIADAWSFWHMTPAEVNGRIVAHSATAQQRAELMDMVAWMTGNYAAQGYHAPKKYPQKPNMVRRELAFELPDEPMGEDDMLTRLSTYAEIHNAIEDVK